MSPVDQHIAALVSPALTPDECYAAIKVAERALAELMALERSSVGPRGRAFIDSARDAVLTIAGALYLQASPPAQKEAKRVAR